jgi:diacylglycerol kinase family enzyme
VRTHSFLVINPRSGDDSPGADELASEAERRGIAAHVLTHDEDPGEVARAARAERIGVAGGDGSLAAVAAIAIESDASFVCVPFGTRNHFARDLGLDRNDPIGALDAFASPVERRIDAGRVNGRLFLNNVSLGVYAGLVHRREHHRRRGEALARLRALVAVAQHRHRLRARVNGEAVKARALFVGNNCYELDLFTLGERARLDEGQLFLWVADGLLPTAWNRSTDAAFRVELSGRVRAAVDGEPAVLEAPLEFASVPLGLRVLVPERTTQQSTEEASMHDNPEATDDEQEAAHEGRQQEEESMRYPEHHDPDEQSGRTHREREE